MNFKIIQLTYVVPSPTYRAGDAIEFPLLGLIIFSNSYFYADYPMGRGGVNIQSTRANKPLTKTHAVSLTNKTLWELLNSEGAMSNDRKTPTPRLPITRPKVCSKFQVVSFQVASNIGLEP